MKKITEPKTQKIQSRKAKDLVISKTNSKKQSTPGIKVLISNKKSVLKPSQINKAPNTLLSPPALSKNASK